MNIHEMNRIISHLAGERRKLGITQIKMAKELGIPPSTISLIESQDRSQKKIFEAYIEYIRAKKEARMPEATIDELNAKRILINVTVGEVAKTLEVSQRSVQKWHGHRLIPNNLQLQCYRVVLLLAELRQVSAHLGHKELASFNVTGKLFANTNLEDNFQVIAKLLHYAGNRTPEGLLRIHANFVEK